MNPMSYPSAAAPRNLPGAMGSPMAVHPDCRYAQALQGSAVSGLGRASAMGRPRENTARITPTPDDERSTRFELDRMVEYVREDSHDPRVVALVRDVMQSVADYEGRPDYQVAQLAAWFTWCRQNVQYVFDPISYVCDGDG